MSSGMPVPRAKSLPVPSGSRPSGRVRRARGACASARPPRAGCRRRRPTTIRATAGAVQDAVELARVGGRGHLDRRRPRAGRSSAASRVSWSAVPASALVITSRGSTARTVAHRGRRVPPDARGPTGTGRSHRPGGRCDSVTPQEPRCACAGASLLGAPRTAHRRGGLTMPAIVVLGAQWGDEGKGKATDLLATTEPIDFVRPHQRRQQRRPHDRGRRREVRHPPAAQRHPHARLPPGDRQRRRGRRPRRCSASSTGSIEPRRRRSPASWSAPTPTSSRRYHTTIDKVTERFLGKNQIGTTGRGIGPAYADKINRVGIRIADLFDEGILRQKVEAALDVKNHLLAKVYNRRAIEVEASSRSSLSYADRLRPMVARHLAAAQQGARRGPDRALRGRPGDHARRRPRHLPVRHLVATRSPAASCAGAGIGPTRIDRVIGVIKAYTTRVGSGPFPTELLRRGRRRRCADRRRDRRHDRPHRVAAAGTTPSSPATPRRVNGLTEFFLTKLDILGGWDGSRSAWPTRSTASASTRCR